MFSARWPAACTPHTSPAITRSSSVKSYTRTSIRASRYFSFAADTHGLPADSCRGASLVMPADRISFDSVLGAPLICHLVANFPKLRKEFVAHPVLENFHGPPF